MTDVQKKACGVIAEHYGIEKQEIQAVQELSELTCVLTRRKDQRDAGHRERVLDEIADSLVMIEQMRQLHGFTEADVEEKISYKLNRQLERIEGENDDKP